jgi:hypothetical protein
MSDVFQVISRDDQSSLRLEAHDRDYFLAELRGLNLHAQARVGTYLSGGLADLFGEMARQWRGWEGRKTWSSLEGELHLTAEADRTGHVTLVAELREGAPSVWSVELVLVIEAGQLEQLARQARTFEASALSAT